jgi:hypothetical protein
MHINRSVQASILAVALMMGTSDPSSAQNNPTEQSSPASEAEAASARSAANLITTLASGATCRRGDQKRGGIYIEHTLFHRSTAALEGWVAQIGAAADQGTFANMRLDIADAALKGECYDIADFEYRYVMQKYAGNAYQAYQERAKIGIEEVRARGASTNSPAPAK